ncbi:succinylglutamate desuccinylase/aspartoacylase family protein [Pacificimonas sp. WHA3]|uniref:Succinylglutamate desuccinylase/aspartoacylase family protein n=2 Tax=Pacificimonas pallii TaxID=2827236 RepID=A0ABS6SEW5_9SPHN|nr:succinylglutamate desuccinylase/aspartoacylase family protein [Pacificimonas pallii]
MEQRAASGKKASPFTFQDTDVRPGTSQAFDVPISVMSSGSAVGMPVHVLHGRRPGPVLFVSAAIHGDEITGVEIVRRLMRKVSPASLAGTLICVPIVNVYGFIGHSRYLPDRRDLNRSFPGSPNGSLASQLANIFHTEIIQRADFGIDLHSAAVHRHNLPQIRVSAGAGRAAALAAAFGAPAIITSKLRDQSLRKVAADSGVEMLLYEAGEGLRFDELSIRVGVRGVMRVMAAMDMLAAKRLKTPLPAPARATQSSWLRAPRGGICVMKVRAGDTVHEGDTVALVTDPAGTDEMAVHSPVDGVIIGIATLPIVNQGDALMHIAEVKAFHTVGDRITENTEDLLAEIMPDEDELL